MKNLWTPWLILASLFTVGMVAFYVSTTPTNVSFPLAKGTKLTVSSVRLEPKYLALFLEFKRAGDDNRPELGHRPPFVESKKNGYNYYPSPGEPVKIRITKVASKESAIYEALPKDRCVYDRCRRTLVPYIDDGDSKRFPFSASQGMVLHAGWTVLQIEVIEVGERISDEQVTLTIKPPLDIKLGASGPVTELLVWFFFWPFYALVLLLWGALLILIGLPGKPE